MTAPTIKSQEAALRLELKQWEKCFSALNEGRHPTRDDIKQDARIGMSGRTRCARWKADQCQLHDISSTTTFAGS